MATNFGSGVVSEYADAKWHETNTSTWNQVYEMFADVEVHYFLKTIYKNLSERVFNGQTFFLWPRNHV